MPWKPEHKEHSKEKILECAAALFTERGYDGVSIDHIMQTAGLTRGGFYAHFKSKSDVYSQAILHAAQCASKLMQTVAGDPKNAAKHYLAVGRKTPSPNTGLHKQAGEDYCPLASLISDIGQQDEPIKNTYTQVLRGFQGFYEAQGLSTAQAIQVTTQLIGALALSKTVTDEVMKRALLDNALAAAESLMA